MENPNFQGNIKDGYLDRLKKNWDVGEYSRFLRILIKSIPVALSILILSLVTAYFIVRWTSPVYEASSIIQLGQNDKANKILEVNQIFEEDDLFAELEFIQSNLLINKTIENLPLSVRYFSEGNLLTHEKYPNGSYTVDSLAIKNNEIYGKKIYINFKSNSVFDLIMDNQTHADLQTNKIHDLEGIRFSIALGPVKMGEDESVKSYFTISSNEMLVDEFKDKLKVKPFNARAKSLVVQAKGQNPILVRDFVNAHVNSFMLYGQERQSKSAENILSFIDNQLDTVSKNLQDAEQLLSSFRSQNKLNGSSTTTIFENLDAYDNEGVELDFQSSILDEIEKLLSLDDSQIDVYNLIALLVNSDYKIVLKGMLSELGELLKNREEIKYSVTEQSETMKTLNYRIGIQKKLSLESIKSLKSKLINKKNLLKNKKDLLEGQFVTLPSKEVELARYQRLFNISEKYYNLLLEKRTEYKISKAGYVSKNKVLSKAQSKPTPISPKSRVIYGSALILGLILSIIYTLIRYLSYNKINSLNDIVKHSGASIAVLGIVPEVKRMDENSAIMIKADTKSMLAESLRSIKTNLRFIEGKKSCTTLALTSTISGEGKTFISLNLGAIMSLANKKVLVVDMDLRKPKVHLSFGAKNEKGLSSILAGIENYKDCVQSSEMSGLHYITSGPIPPNPYELLNNEEMKTFLANIQEEFDIVIFDTPPIGLVSDGFSILQWVDCPIYIFRNEFSKTNFVHNMDRLAHESGLNKMSAILNGIDVSSSYYGRRLGYGYGYISNSKMSKEYFDDAEIPSSPWWKRF